MSSVFYLGFLLMSNTNKIIEKLFENTHLCTNSLKELSERILMV